MRIINGPCPDPRLCDELQWGDRHPDWSWFRYLIHMQRLRRQVCRLRRSGKAGAV